jgi:hypothetical protein
VRAHNIQLSSLSLVSVSLGQRESERERFLCEVVALSSKDAAATAARAAKADSNYNTWGAVQV